MKSYLPITGTRVVVVSAGHRGAHGIVLEKQPEWGLSERAIAVKLDDWPDEPYFTFYCHNLFREDEVDLLISEPWTGGVTPMPEKPKPNESHKPHMNDFIFGVIIVTLLVFIMAYCLYLVLSILEKYL